MRRVATLFGLWLCACGAQPVASTRASAGAASPPGPSATPPSSVVFPAGAASGDLEITMWVSAWDTALSGDVVLVVDPGVASVSGYDATTGARRWRTPVGEPSGGRHTLRVRGSSVLLWAGRRLHRIDAATGRLLSTEEVPDNGDCSFRESGSACAFECSCSLQLAECDTGKRIGARYDKTYVEMFGHDGPPNAGCFGMGVGLVVGAAGVAVVEVEDPKGKTISHFSRDHVLLGLDAASGRELWRSRALSASSGNDSGAASGRVWTSSSDGDLRILDPRTGSIVAQRAGAPDLGRVPRHLVEVDATGGRLFRFLEGEATLTAISSGALLWRANVPAGAWATLEGAAVPVYALEAKGEPVTVLILDPARGSVRGRLELPLKSTVHADPGGGFYVSGRDLAGFEADGRERARVSPVDPPNFEAGPDYGVLFSEERTVILDRRDLRKVADLQGSFAVQPGSSLAGRMLLYRFVERGRSPGEAIVLRKKTR